MFSYVRVFALPLPGKQMRHTVTTKVFLPFLAKKGKTTIFKGFFPAAPRVKIA